MADARGRRIAFLSLAPAGDLAYTIGQRCSVQDMTKMFWPWAARDVLVDKLQASIFD